MRALLAYDGSAGATEAVALTPVIRRVVKGDTCIPRPVPSTEGREPLTMVRAVQDIPLRHLRETPEPATPPVRWSRRRGDPGARVDRGRKLADARHGDGARRRTSGRPGSWLLTEASAGLRPGGPSPCPSC